MAILTDDAAMERLTKSPLHLFETKIVPVLVTKRPEGCHCISPDVDFSEARVLSLIYCVCGAANRDNT